MLVAGANDFSEQGLIVLVGWGVLSYSWSYAWSTILFLIGAAARPLVPCRLFLGPGFGLGLVGTASARR